MIMAADYYEVSDKDKGIALLKSIETLVVKAYDDQTVKQNDHWVKVATIGYGHHIRQDQWKHDKDGISEQADWHYFGMISNLSRMRLPMEPI
jgi:hypothetical protein